METYLFEVTYDNMYADNGEDEISVLFGTIGGEDYGDAANRIKKRFGNGLIDMKLRQMLMADGFTFLSRSVYNDLLKEEEEGL